MLWACSLAAIARNGMMDVGDIVLEEDKVLLDKAVVAAGVFHRQILWSGGHVLEDPAPVCRDSVTEALQLVPEA